MQQNLTVGESARRLDANPRDITGLFYDRVLSDDIAPIIAGRRSIPEHYLPTIRAELARRGYRVGAGTEGK